MTSLPYFTVKNWIDTADLRIASDSGPGNSLVTMSAHVGPFSFVFNTTPAQARELADALNACADALEAEVMEVTT